MKRYLIKMILQLTADKKKMGLLLCALSLGLLLWGRLLLQGVPRTATAVDKYKTAQADDSPENTDPKTGSKINPKPIIYVDPDASPHLDLTGTDPNRYKQTSPTAYPQAGPKSAQVIPDVDTRMAVIRRQARGLHLESTVIGDRPAAYINGRLLALGEEYEGFKLIQVTDEYVLLTKNGLIVRLEM